MTTLHSTLEQIRLHSRSDREKGAHDDKLWVAAPGLEFVSAQSPP